MDHSFSGTLFLTGFMGAGKSTVGQVLADRLNCPFLDLDALIVARAGKSIAAIFAAEGEPAFRHLETETLLSLPTGGLSVCATGGGLVVSAANRRFMRANGRIVYLRARWATLQARLTGSSGRPLASAAHDWASVHALLRQRLPVYAEADLIVDTDGRSVDNIVASILDALPGEGHA